MEKPYILAYPQGTDEELLNEVDRVVEEISQNEDYKMELEKTYKQPVDYYAREEALDLLGKILDEYSKYQDMLR